MKADHIPFLNSPTDCEIAAKWYGDSAYVRISLETLSKTAPRLPNGPQRWLDPAIDGLHWPKLTSTAYQDHVSRFESFDRIRDKAFQDKPDKKIVNSFVESVLDYCVSQMAAPDWLTIPQLPIIDGSSRNKINRMLAESTRNWVLKRAFAGRLILPAIFTNQRQLNSKTERNKKLGAFSTCYKAAVANGIWIVDATLNDQDGSRTFEQTRFPSLVSLHSELQQIFPPEVTVIAGPYWGMNTVLWARGLASYSAIGMGNSYQYHIPGNVVLGGKSRIAISPLRRWAIATPDLRKWLNDVLTQLPPGDPSATEFSSLLKEFSRLQQPVEGRRQIAEFYKGWFDKFATLPPPGRAVALYQDLSLAYVLGKALPQLPDEEKTARSAARVAKQLMLNCL